MATPQSLNDLNNDVLHVLCKQLSRIEPDDGKETLRALARTNRIFNDIARCYLFRDIIFNLEDAEDVECASQAIRGLRTISQIDTMRRLVIITDMCNKWISKFVHDSELFHLCLNARKLSELVLIGINNNKFDIEQDDYKRLEAGALSNLRDLAANIQIGFELVIHCPVLVRLTLHGDGATTIPWFNGKISFPTIRFFEFDNPFFTQNLLLNLSKSLPGLEELVFGPADMKFEALEHLPTLVKELSNLKSLTMPDIAWASGPLEFMKLAVGYAKPCMEIVARRAFNASAQLAEIVFLVESILEDEPLDEGDDRSILGAQRSGSGVVEKILWLQKDLYVKTAIADKDNGCRDGEEDIRLWVDKEGEVAAKYLETFGDM